jgi:hypothetical protein
MRRVTAALDKGFVSEVEKRGVLYKRNFRDRSVSTGDAFWDAVHRSWQDSFNTDDPNQPVSDCKAMGLDVEWLADGSLSTIYRSPGMITHPRTRQRLWFNHIATKSVNPTTMVPERRATFEACYGAGNRPRWSETTFNDGGAIPREWIDQLQDVLRAHAVAFPWSHGDVLLVDNTLTAHGRNSYTGLRDVQVALLA